MNRTDRTDHFVLAWMTFGCVLAGHGSLNALAQESLADVIERAEKSVIRIEVTGAEDKSLGSGFVVDDQGTIITNCHVLAGARRATAHFPDGKNCPVLGSLVIDQSRDIVVARIAITSAPPISLASALPRKGERVTALGSPRGLSFTATTGIVSATRSAKEMAEDVGMAALRGVWIQVDAALSPGNSGGPLINGAGEVVAMSTLASQGGAAQNLNFGISAQDVRQAMRQAQGQPLMTLEAGVGKIQSQQREAGGMATRERIPESAMDAYIAAGREDFGDLVRGLRMEVARLGVELKEMRKGESYLPANARRDGAAVARVTIPGKRNRVWFFRDQDVKTAAISKQQERIRNLNKIKNRVRSLDDPESMISLLWNYGPKLDPKRNRSVGFASGLIVVHAFNEHDVLALLDDNPYLLWMESTAGMTAGEIFSGPTFVAGTATAVLQSGVTSSLTVLQEVTEQTLRAAVGKRLGGVGSNANIVNSPGNATVEGGFRVWNDRTGRFSLEASLLSSDENEAVLKKRDGSVVRVPLVRLSDGDLKYIRQ